MTGSTIETRTDAYRRRARRLRHIYAADPAGLQHSLAQLSRSCGRRTSVTCGFAGAASRNSSAAWPATPQAAEYLAEDASRNDRAAHVFADFVADQMTGPVLHYSAREALIRHATRSGIGRFEANLIIAAVQYRTAGIARPETDRESPRRFGFGALFVTAALVQGTILAAVWWLAF